MADIPYIAIIDRPALLTPSMLTLESLEREQLLKREKCAREQEKQKKIQRCLLESAVITRVNDLEPFIIGFWGECRDFYMCGSIDSNPSQKCYYSYVKTELYRILETGQVIKDYPNRNKCIEDMTKLTYSLHTLVFELRKCLPAHPMTGLDKLQTYKTLFLEKSNEIKQLISLACDSEHKQRVIEHVELITRETIVRIEELQSAIELLI